MDDLKLPCASCYQLVPCRFFCPTFDKAAKKIQDINGQMCLDCIGLRMNKYPCNECMDFLDVSKYSNIELEKGRYRECNKCSKGPAKGLRDSDLLFSRKFECWNCEASTKDIKRYTCSKCQRPTYCSRNCQKLDWAKNHKSVCETQSLIAQRNGLIKTKSSKDESKSKNKKKNAESSSNVKKSNEKRCSVCQIVMQKSQWKSHVNGKKHKKKISHQQIVT